MVNLPYLQAFVAIDLETTGLDPQSARIIELGAVKVFQGQIQDRFEQLVDPGIPIPVAITRITGINDADCRGKPTIDVAMPRFLAFTGNCPLVAHNASFDLAFVKANLPGHETFSNTSLDTLQLARILYPRLRDHKLATLQAFFSIQDGSQAHRAADDAAVVAALLLALVEQLCNLDPNTLQLLHRLARGGGSSGLLTLLQEAQKEAVHKAFQLKPVSPSSAGLSLQDYSNLIGFPDPRASIDYQPPEQEEPISEEQIIDLFEEYGPLARALSQYEFRDQQVEMARQVIRAFNQDQFLVIEAGTGTGKSLAYLIPAILWAVKNHRRVIISTNTKNLQEQLFFKDIPFLHRVLGISFRAALLKGRGNYLCPQKWARLLAEPEMHLTNEERLELLPVVTWLKETRSGDLAENTGFKSRRFPGLANKICADAHFCAGPHCTQNEHCFVTRIRKAAIQSHLVIVNHSLLFSDLATENAILDPYQHLILDEAHNLEKVAIHYLTLELNPWRVRGLCRRLYYKEGVEFGLLVILQRNLQKLANTNNVKALLLEQVTRLMEQVNRTERETRQFFQDLTTQILFASAGREGPYTARVRYQPGDALVTYALDRSAGFEQSLAILAEDLKSLGEALRPLPESILSDRDGLIEQFVALAEEAEEIVGDLYLLLGAEDEQYVYWAEAAPKDPNGDARLFAAPLDIAEQLDAYFYRQLCTVVFTSATLAVGESFEYYCKRVGLDRAEPDRVRSLAVGSPFRYNEQTLVCIPTYFPSPRSPTFQKAVDTLLRDVSLATRRGTLALYTSYHMLNKSYQSLHQDLGEESILLLAQGIHGSRSNLLAQFKSDSGSVLLGTDSFWEGVDVPGQALEVLVLVKLPFAVPSDPIVAAQMEAIEKTGANAFMAYSVPEAVIKFRQGFGRLIRTRNDRGVVIVLDNRVAKTRYGPLFLESIPGTHEMFTDHDAMLDRIVNWFS